MFPSSESESLIIRLGFEPIKTRRQRKSVVDPLSTTSGFIVNTFFSPLLNEALVRATSEIIFNLTKYLEKEQRRQFKKQWILKMYLSNFHEITITLGYRP